MSPGQPSPAPASLRQLPTPNSYSLQPCLGYCQQANQSGAEALAPAVCLPRLQCHMTWDSVASGLQGGHMALEELATRTLEAGEGAFGLLSGVTTPITMLGVLRAVGLAESKGPV